VAYRRARPLFVWIAAIPILLLAASAWRRAHYRDLSRELDHTREVQGSIQDLLVSLNDAETARRGYIVQGDASYLAALEGSTAKSSAIIHTLRQLTQDNPIQQGNVQMLEGLVTNRLALLNQTSQLGRSGENEMVRDLERRKGLAESTQLSRVMGEMITEENRLLDLRKTATSLADSEADGLLVAGSIATILLLVWAYRILSQYAIGRARAEAEVRQANQQLQEKISQLDRLNHELEARVAERTAGLARSNQDLQQFAFVASHDLQEPLRMVVSYLGLLAKVCQGKLDVEADKYIGFAVEGATRMQVLIRDLLAYAQVSSQAPVLTRTRLKEVVSQARYSLLESIRESGAEITSGPLPDLEADPLKMSLVFQNLISNAIKFRQPAQKPQIHIEARNDGGVWRVSVSDRGIGFDPKYSEKIFGAFQRLHGKSEYPGTGIGLAICKRIIEWHGGRIWAEARPGEGATFHFTLPALAESLSAAFDSAETASISSGDTRGTGPRASASGASS
jgi:signal transduction histidine kinase